MLAGRRRDSEKSEEGEEERFLPRELQPNSRQSLFDLRMHSESSNIVRERREYRLREREARIAKSGAAERSQREVVRFGPFEREE